MGANKTTQATAPEVAALSRRVARWRSTRKQHGPMPEALWSAAIRLAQKHGLYPVAHGLRVSYESLKCRLAIAHSQNGGSGRQVEPSTFVEVNMREVGWPGATQIELSDAGGATMRIQCAQSSMIDLEGLVGTFFAERS